MLGLGVAASAPLTTANDIQAVDKDATARAAFLHDKCHFFSRCMVWSSPILKLRLRIGHEGAATGLGTPMHWLARPPSPTIGDRGMALNLSPHVLSRSQTPGWAGLTE